MGAKKTKPQLEDEVGSLRVRIDELESSLSAARESEEMFRRLLDSIDDRVRAKDAEGRYQYVNPALAEADGLTQAEMIGKTVGDLYDDKTASEILRVEADALLGETVRKPTKRETPHGERLFDLVISPMRDSSSRIVGTIAVSRDVTERHRAEGAYRESEERFRQVVENMETGLWLRDPRREEVLYANQAWLEIWGTRNAAGRIDLIHPDDRGRLVSRTLEQLDDHDVEQHTAFRIVREDGDVRWIECRTFPIRDERGDVYRYAGTVDDVTDRTNAELERDRLARENETLAEITRIISSSSDIDVVYDQFASRLRPMVRFDGIVINLLEPDGETLVSAYMLGEALEQYWSKGRRIPLEGTLSQNAITERRAVLFAAEDEPAMRVQYPGSLPAFEIGYRSVVGAPLITGNEAIGTLILLSEQSDTYTESDRAFVERVSNQVAGAISIAQLYGDQQRDKEDVERLAREHEVLATIGRVITSSLDVNEVYEQFANQVLQLLPADRIDIVSVDQANWTLTYEYVYGIKVDSPSALPGFTRTLEGSVVEAVVRGKSGILVVPQDEDDLFQHFPIFSDSYEYGFRSWMMLPLKAGGEVIGMLALLNRKELAYSDTDLSLGERVADQIAGAISNARLHKDTMRAEADLRESELRYKTVVEATDDSIALKDSGGRYLMANQALLKHMGRTQAEIVGKTPFDLYRYEEASRSVAADKRVLETGRPVESEVRVNRDGAISIYLDRRVAIHGEGGNATGLVTVGRDITERKRAEDELRQYSQRLQTLSRRLVQVQEDERRNLARELHDEIGQELTGLKLSLAVISPPQADQLAFARSLELVDGLIDRTRDLSLNLRPSMLDDLGIVPALRWLLKRVREQSGVVVRMRHHGSSKGISPEAKTAMYRVVQESLTNVVRHSGATEAEVTIDFADGVVTTEVVDQGKGFAPERAWRFESTGLTGMRERCELMGGTFQVESNLGSGTRVRAEFDYLSRGQGAEER